MDTVDILTKEYLQIMSVIQNFDDLSMIIKGWSITVGVALIGYSLKYNKRLILLVCCFGALSFMLVDAKYKEYQENYYPRMQAIEKCIKVVDKKESKTSIATSKCVPLKVDESWFESKNWTDVFLQFKKSNIYFPHAFIFLMSLLLFFIWKPIIESNE